MDPGCSGRIAEAVAAKGGRFLEAPVSGSKGPAIAGQLIFLAAVRSPWADPCFWGFRRRLPARTPAALIAR